MTRAYIDAQNAGAAHKVWQGGPVGQSNSYSIPLNRPATTEELQALREPPRGWGWSPDASGGVPARSPRRDDLTIVKMLVPVRR
jgi:hypothetical protein